VTEDGGTTGRGQAAKDEGWLVRSRKGSPQLVRSVLRRVSTEQSPGPARGYVRPQDPACATSSHSNRQRNGDRGSRDCQPLASPSQA